MKMARFIIFMILMFTLFTCSSLVKPEDSEVPDYVAHPEGYVSMLLPPNGFSAATPWFCGIHLDDQDESSYIDLDYMRLYAVIGGQSVLLYSDDYSTAGSVSGGLYLKHPWFGSSDFHDDEIPYTAYPDSGFVRLHTSDRNDRVFHLWNRYRSLVPVNAEKCWVEVNCRITGPAGVQIGMDFWRDLNAPYAGYNVNNVEAGASDWYFQSAYWQIIRFGNGSISDRASYFPPSTVLIY